MQQNDPHSDALRVLRAGTDFCDIYIVTQGGSVRRTALPFSVWIFAAWLMQPHTDIEPEWFDEITCREADASHCGYAEALMVVIDGQMNGGMMGKYLAAKKNVEDFRKRERAFLQVQKQREEVWREDNNEWRTDLPPDLS
jgi:hypothetical protein